MINVPKWPNFPYHTPVEFGVDAADDSATRVSGEDMVPFTSFAGSNVNSNIAEVADITNPSSWTTVWTITGPCIVQIITIEGQDARPGFAVVVDSAEDANDAIRMKLELDGNDVFDMYVIRNAGSDQVATALPLMFSSAYKDIYSFTSVSLPIKVNSSMVLKGACRDGNSDNFAQAQTRFSVPAILINTY